MNKPNIYLSRGKWCVEHSRGTAISDSIEAAWALYIQVFEGYETGYYSTPGSSLLKWAGNSVKR